VISSILPVEAFIVLVARFSLGIFFLPSALGKLANQRSFIRGVVAYQILPKRIARTFGLVLPWIELILAIALIGGIALFITGLATACLLICFITAVIINLRRGREIACSCYGIAGTQMISWGNVVRNVLLLLLVTPIIGFAPNVFRLDQLLTLWQTDSMIFSSITFVILLFLLIAFCFVTINLIDWTIHIYFRASHLKVPVDQ
jgi:hypothetical protein